MKSRNLSKLDYLDALQKEYFEAKLRRAIYPKRKDKDYYSRLIDHKTEKILDVSKKNNLENIFQNDELFYQYNEAIRPKSGLPKMKMNKKDLIYYFLKDNDFRVNSAEFNNVKCKSDFSNIKDLLNGYANFIIDGKPHKLRINIATRII